MTSRQLVHLLSWATLLSALPLISMGAIVTTVDAGMAFPDWPTSDGHGMLAYPWLKSTGDKFLEHGHRLAGMLTGFLALLLAGTALFTKQTWRVKAGALLILVLICFQGLLGGLRVEQVSRVLALVHGNFAAWVFTAMAVMIATTGRNWIDAQPIPADKPRGWAWGFSITLCVVFFLQSILGGMLRHLGAGHAWRDHPRFAFVVMFVSIAMLISVWSLRQRWLTRWAIVCFLLVNVQFALGLLTWWYRYGWPEWDIVAVQQTSALNAIRSLHTLGAIFGFMGLGVLIARLVRVAPLGRPDVAVTYSKKSLAGGPA